MCSKDFIHSQLLEEGTFMKCVGIIWNCAFEFREDILKNIAQYATVESFYNIDLKSDYEIFLRSIYSFESIAKWKVDKKVEYMKKYPSTSICVVHFDINTSNVRYHEKKKHFVYSDLQDLKDFIRDFYKTKLPFYFFDIIFHCSETLEEYEADTQIISLFH